MDPYLKIRLYQFSKIFAPQERWDGQIVLGEGSYGTIILDEESGLIIKFTEKTLSTAQYARIMLNEILMLKYFQ